MSLRMRTMGACMRPMVRSVMARAQKPDILRKHFDRSARYFFRPVPQAFYSKTTYSSASPMAALWVSAGPVKSEKVLLYLHGGGFIAGNPGTHRKLVARLCRISGLRAFVPAYRLAPENPLPAALEDAEAAHSHLMKLGYSPDEVILGGDSAGGGLALSLLARLCQSGQAPAAAFAWSPFCDQSFSGISVSENGKKDHFFPGDRVHELADMVLGEMDPNDPAVSPLFAEFPSCPPVLLQVSSSEILRDDAYRMAEKLLKTGSDVRLETWEDAPHVWQIFDGWFPEAREAIANTAEFLKPLSLSKSGN